MLGMGDGDTLACQGQGEPSHAQQSQPETCRRTSKVLIMADPVLHGAGTVACSSAVHLPYTCCTLCCTLRTLFSPPVHRPYRDTPAVHLLYTAEQGHSCRTPAVHCRTPTGCYPSYTDLPYTDRLLPAVHRCVPERAPTATPPYTVVPPTATAWYTVGPPCSFWFVAWVPVGESWPLVARASASPPTMPCLNPSTTGSDGAGRTAPACSCPSIRVTLPAPLRTSSLFPPVGHRLATVGHPLDTDWTPTGHRWTPRGPLPDTPWTTVGPSVHTCWTPVNSWEFRLVWPLLAERPHYSHLIGPERQPGRPWSSGQSGHIGWYIGVHGGWVPLRVLYGAVHGPVHVPATLRCSLRRRCTCKRTHLQGRARVAE